MTYAEAMSRYGSDKPDLRYGLDFKDVSAAVRDCSFRCAGPLSPAGRATCMWHGVWPAAMPGHGGVAGREAGVQTQTSAHCCKLAGAGAWEGPTWPALRVPPRRVFAGAVADGGIVKAIVVPDGKRISNSRVKPKGDISNEAVAAGAAGLASIRVQEDGAIDAAKPIKEGLSDAQAQQLLQAAGAQPVGAAVYWSWDVGAEMGLSERRVPPSSCRHDDPGRAGSPRPRPPPTPHTHSSRETARSVSEMAARSVDGSPLALSCSLACPCRRRRRRVTSCCWRRGRPRPCTAPWTASGSSWPRTWA